MNSKWHLTISFAKSLIRIIGATMALVTQSLGILAITIALAEVLGIAEEFGDKR